MRKLTTALLTLRTFVLLGLLALVPAACSFPGVTTPTQVNTEAPVPVNPAYTAAAQTIIAQLTAVAPTPATLEPGVASTESILADSTPASQPDAASDATSAAPGTQTPTSSSAPTLELSPTPEPAFTATSLPQPSPTLATDDPAAQLGEPDWRDTFANANNWPLFEDEHVHFRLQEGGLQLVAKQPEKWDGWMLSWTTLFNFYLEVTATPQNCSGADRYGLLARAPSAEKAYLFGLTCDGQYSLRKWNGERFSYLVDWTASDWIKSGAGQTNRLGLMADGNQISLYANGELLEDITDSSYDNGAFGLFISSANTEEFKVMVSQVAYWELP